MWAEENQDYNDLEHTLRNYGIKSEKKFNCGIKNAVIFGKLFHSEFYLPEEELRASHEAGYKFFSNPKKLALFLKEVEDSKNQLALQLKSLIKANLKSLSNAELYDQYDLWGFRIGNVFVCYSMTQPHKITKLESTLTDFLKKKKIQDIPGTLSILTSPKTKFIFNQNNDLSKSFSETVKNEEHKLDLSLINKKLYLESKADLKEKKNLIKKLKVPRKILHLIDVLSILAEERLKMRFSWMLGLYYKELLLIEIKRRYNITKDELRLYEQPEIDELIKTGKKISPEKLEYRKKGLLKIMSNFDISTLEAESAVKFLEENVLKHKQVSEFKGMVASKGKVTGKVILLSYKESENHSEKISKMTQGQILVTEMTRPNIITACKKASAIITDEGGITCHAAIISRELKIPCVIGTKIATQVLKDGDLVEVDAEKGIIKKLF